MADSNIESLIEQANNIIRELNINKKGRHSRQPKEDKPDFVRVTIRGEERVYSVKEAKKIMSKAASRLWQYKITDANKKSKRYVDTITANKAVAFYKALKEGGYVRRLYSSNRRNAWFERTFMI